MFSIDKLSTIIPVFSSIVQVVLTVALVVFTLLYVIYTKKHLDQNYSTFVVLMSMKRSGKSISANVENHGIAVALNVSVIVVSGKNKSIEKTPLNGPFMLVEGEKVIYNGELSSNAGNSENFIEISYQSQTRRPRTEVWKIMDDKIIFLGKK
jgi:hypothetical protein